MTTTDEATMQQAREILAAEYKRDGLDYLAALFNTPGEPLTVAEERAVRAVAAALRMGKGEAVGVDPTKMLRGKVRPCGFGGVAVIDVDCADFGPNTIGDNHEILIHNLTKNPLAAEPGASVGREVDESIRATLVQWYSQGSRHGFRLQAPGHAHEKYAHWDSDNGDLAGVECAKCKLWAIAAALTAGQEGKGNG